MLISFQCYFGSSRSVVNRPPWLCHRLGATLIRCFLRISDAKVLEIFDTSK